MVKLRRLPVPYSFVSYLRMYIRCMCTHVNVRKSCANSMVYNSLQLRDFDAKELILFLTENPQLYMMHYIPTDGPEFRWAQVRELGTATNRAVCSLRFRYYSYV
ncbi:uncharacterized protein LOC143183286 [Calliopsis andreniformis]|uniref:uncharacterized protein LOC143183286 n=1 Tax=Calliopsis andreniformis TaxID=337506 RepID=UPI003FCEC357